MKKLNIFPRIINGLCLIKPNYTQYQDDIEKKLKKNGWEVINSYKKRLDRSDVESLYKKHKNKNFFIPLLSYMTSDDVIVYGLHKNSNNISRDLNKTKQEIRASYDSDDMKNAVHMPDNVEQTETEYSMLGASDPSIAEAQENTVIYKQNDEYNDFVEKIKMLPQNVQKKAIEEYLKQSNNGQQSINIQSLINEITKSNIKEKRMKTFSQILQESGAEHVSNLIDKDELVSLLKKAWCEEINAWYQYIVCAPFLYGLERKNIEKSFKEHAKDELEDHAYWLLERINQLGGDFSGISNLSEINQIATHKFIVPSSSHTVVDALRDNIEAEKCAIETYTELETFTRGKDTVTNRKIKEILADEEEHLQTLEEYLEDLNGLPVEKPQEPKINNLEPSFEPSVELSYEY